MRGDEIQIVRLFALLSGVPQVIPLSLMLMIRETALLWMTN